MRIGTYFLFKLFPLYNLEDHHHALADAEACALAISGIQREQ